MLAVLLLLAAGRSWQKLCQVVSAPAVIRSSVLFCFYFTWAWPRYHLVRVLLYDERAARHTPQPNVPASQSAPQRLTIPPSPSSPPLGSFFLGPLSPSHLP